MCEHHPSPCLQMGPSRPQRQGKLLFGTQKLWLSIPKAYKLTTLKCLTLLGVYKWNKNLRHVSKVTFPSITSSFTQRLPSLITCCIGLAGSANLRSWASAIFGVCKKSYSEIFYVSDSWRTTKNEEVRIKNKMCLWNTKVQSLRLLTAHLEVHDQRYVHTKIWIL